MVSRQKRQLVVIAGVLAIVLLLAMSTGPICLPAPVVDAAGVWHAETRCFLWLSPALQPETPGLALVSLPPDWHPVE